jgi:hypothetical protein
MHQLSAAGTTLEADVGSDGMTRIVGHVVDPVAVSKIRNSVYRGFSIGGRVTARDAADRNVITGLQLNEISLVDRPANPEAVFDCWKATKTIEGNNDMPGLATLGDLPAGEKLAAAMIPVQIWACDIPDHRHLAKADAVECIEKRAAADGDTEAAAVKEPGEDPPAVAEPPVDETADKSASVDKRVPQPNPNTEQPALLAETAIAAAEEAIERGKAVLTPAADSGINAGAEDAEKVLEAPDADADARGKASKEDGKGDKPKGDYGDVEYADPGYQADKKPRYPIDSEKHIRAAWDYINQEKNCAKYGDNCAKVKAKIVAAWKAKIDKEGPPSAEKASNPFDIAKSLYDVGDVAQNIMFLDNLADGLKWEAALEGDDSKAGDQMDAIVGQVCAFLRKRVAEKTNEIMSGTEMDDNAMLQMGAVAENLRKAGLPELAATLDKAVSAKHSAKNQMLLDTAHACATKCMKTDGCSAAMKDACSKACDAMEAAGGKGWSTAKASDTVPWLDSLAKSGGHQALLDTAHDCLKSMSGGATCAGGADKASKEIMGKVAEAHDHLCDAGATCDGAEKAAAAAPALVVDEDQLAKALLERDTERATTAALTKVLGDITPMLVTLTERIDTMDKRSEKTDEKVTAIFNTPIPASAIARTAPNGLSKSADNGGASGDGGRASRLTDDELVAAMKGKTPDEQRIVLIKAAPQIVPRSLANTAQHRAMMP